MKLFDVSLLVASIAGVAANLGLSYDGYKVYRVNTRGRLKEIKDKMNESVPHWSQWASEDSFIDVVVPPDSQASFESLDLRYTTTQYNLGDSIVTESTFPHSSKWRRQEGGDGDAWFDSYHAYEDHVQYFKDLQESFPNNSEIVSSGESYEGRDIFGLHVWGDDGPGKPAILWYGTAHAREWIVAPVLEFLTLKLVEGYQTGNESEVAVSVLDEYDYYVFPFINPDGFIYSQENDRMWRKTRQPPPPGANSSCYGVDLNRNYELTWDAHDRGASRNPCDVDYRGESAASTPEARNLDNFASKISEEQGIKMFIDWHSYGQYIMFPWSYNETLYPPELGKWHALAAHTSRAIINHDVENIITYLFGPNGATLYPTTGSAPDHMYAKYATEFAYTIELRDLGQSGFVLPPEMIRPVSEEMWTGMQLMLVLMGQTFFDGVGVV